MPFLPFPAKFTKGEDLRNFLLAKRTPSVLRPLHARTHTTGAVGVDVTLETVINGGLAALHSPEFLSSLRRTRKELLAEVMKKP
jgi:hypothetical protein